MPDHTATPYDLERFLLSSVESPIAVVTTTSCLRQSMEQRSSRNMTRSCRQVKICVVVSFFCSKVLVITISMRRELTPHQEVLLPMSPGNSCCSGLGKLACCDLTDDSTGVGASCLSSTWKTLSCQCTTSSYPDGTAFDDKKGVSVRTAILGGAGSRDYEQSNRRK
jgi:hypothetical protein